MRETGILIGRVANSAAGCKLPDILLDFTLR